MFSLSRALKIATCILRNISPSCEVANIAGSIRRLKQDVKDIEIVCVPKRIKVGSVNLFGEDDREEIISPDFVDEVNKLGKIIKGKPDGRMMQIQLPEKIILDLFMPMPYDYWRQFAIRTGSADYSQKVIATGWNKIGWCGTPDGLRLQGECNAVKYKSGKDERGNDQYKTKWELKESVTEPTKPPVWESEKGFFDWLGVQYLSPNLRNI
jgi:DNA polymerase/3'-5' exonuclease PolX